MTLEEALALQKKGTGTRHGDEEHRIQVSMVRWFRLAYPQYAGLLWATPNGSVRDAITGKRLKDEGVLRGVADLFLAIPGKDSHGLFIETKTPKGTQQPTQRLFQKNVTGQGYRYEICRSLDDFIRLITSYI